MSSDHNPARSSGDSAAATADDAPCTSTAGSGGRKVKLVCAYGGKILPRPIDGVLRYAGGESRIINLRRDTSLPEFLRKMAETYGGPVAVRYQLPDEDLDSLISVSTPEDLENMMDEVDEIAEENPSAKLRVFLLSPAEVVGVPMDQHYSGKDRQDQNTMYIEAVNGLDNRLPRKDSMASVSSTQNSDGAIGVEAAADGFDEGTSPSLLLPTGTNAHDQSKPIMNAAQNTHDLPIAICSIDQNEVYNATQSELPPSITYLQESYVNPHQSQFRNSQPFLVADLHQQVNVASLPPSSYVLTTHDALLPISQPGNGMPIQREEDPVFEEKASVGKITKVQSDSMIQPQLPPLPPAHFLAPKGQAIRLEECSLCQKTLPHSHSETVINDKVNGTRIAKQILQIHRGDDSTGMRAPQVDVIEAFADDVAEVQPGNLVSATPLVSYEMSCNIERPNVLGASNLVQTKTLGQGSAASVRPPSLAIHDTVKDLKIAQQDAPHALDPDRENNDHSIFMCQPTLWPDDMLNEPPKSCWEEDLQGQLQFPQDIITLDQEPINQPLVDEFSSVRNPSLQESVFAQFSSCNKVAEGMIGSLYVSPSGSSSLSDQSKQVVLPKMAISKDSRPDILLSVIENGIAAKPLDEPNTIPLNDLLLNSGVVPYGDTLPVDPLGSTDQEFIYIQSPQAAKANHTLHATANNPLIDIGMPDYTYNNMINKHLAEDKKDDTSKSQAKEIFGDIVFPLSGNSQIDPNNQITNTELFQGQVLSNSLFFNDDPQKILGSAPVLSPSPTNVSGKESIVMNESLPDIQSSDTNVSGAMVLKGVSTYPSQFSEDLGTELILPLKDYEHIEQVMSASAEERVAPLVYLSKPLINNFASDHSNNEERGTKENTAERADEKDEAIKDDKQPSKLINGFPTTVDMGHLQVIKNSDLEELQELGSGTFGTVYHGKWRGSDVAIKRLNELVFSGKPSDQEKARADFWNEASKLSSLHHPNVVTLYGVALDGPGGTIATVTEFMVNGSLRNALAKNDKTLDWRKRLLISMDVAFGMEYLHSRNIIHFDLKSDNLLVNLRDPQRPICKVGDLGLSRVKFETLMSGGMRGTLPWMAPELLDGKTKCTEKIDVYSFGIVMWELLTGDEPYAELHYGAIIGGIVKNTLRPSVPESCDAEWRSLMEQCWSVEPTERPSFTEIASRLRSLGATILKEDKTTK